MILALKTIENTKHNTALLGLGALENLADLLYNGTSDVTQLLNLHVLRSCTVYPVFTGFKREAFVIEVFCWFQIFFFFSRLSSVT